MTSLFIRIAGVTLCVFAVLWGLSFGFLWTPLSPQKRKWKASRAITSLWTQVYLGVASLEGCVILGAALGRWIAPPRT